MTDENKKITFFEAEPLSRWADLTESEKEEVLQSMVDRFKSTIFKGDEPESSAT